MIIDDHHYDFIIIGSGAGGATLARQLSKKGKWVLVLERGGQLPLEEQNIVGTDLFRKTRYHPKGENWLGPDGDPFAPQTVYALGGNTKIWGAVLERMRTEDFEELPLQDGTSPSWPISYEELEPFYGKAEEIYNVKGSQGIDKTEPDRSKGYENPPKSIEPLFKEIQNILLEEGFNPYYLPISWPENTQDIDFDNCAMFQKGDSQLYGIYNSNQDFLKIKTNAKVVKLDVNSSGKSIKGVEAEIDGDKWLFSSDVVILAAGAINTPIILLNSKSSSHPNGLGNSSNMVGKNLMNIQMTCILQRANNLTSGYFPKSLGLNDFYFGDKNVNFPLGHIQTGGGVLRDAFFAESPPVLSLITRFIPDFGLKNLAKRSISWWAMTEVLPDPENAVTIQNNRVKINYIHNNLEAHDRLVYRWLDTLKVIENNPLSVSITQTPAHPRGLAPLSIVGYSCGTCKMGNDPKTSVVNKNGKCHDIDNLYISDASIFPSCPSIGHGLTVIALSLKLGDYLTSGNLYKPLICRP